MAAHAAKKRRPEDEAEEEMHLAFRGAANALSQVYTQAVAHQKASFLAGEYHGMNEIEQRAEDMPASSQHPSLQPAYNFPSANVQSNSFSFGNVAAALNSRMCQTDQTRIVGISNALSNPLRQTFHSNHLVQCSGYGPIYSLPNGNGAPNNHSPQNQDSYEPSMDMNHDAP